MIFNNFKMDVDSEESSRVYHCPLLWFYELLPLYIRFILATSIVAFLLYKSANGTNGPFGYFKGNFNAPNTQPNEDCSSDDAM